jgi:MFS family permease
VVGGAVFELEARAGTLALLVAVFSLASLIGTATAGVLIDRLGPRRVV